MASRGSKGPAAPWWARCSPPSAPGGSASTRRGFSWLGRASASCSRPPWAPGWNIAGGAPYNGQLLPYNGPLLKESRHEAHRGDRGVVAARRWGSRRAGHDQGSSGARSAGRRQRQRRRSSGREERGRPSGTGHGIGVSRGRGPARPVDQGQRGRRNSDPPRVVPRGHTGGRRRAAGGRLTVAHLESKVCAGGLDRAVARRGEGRGGDRAEADRLHGRAVTVTSP